MTTQTGIPLKGLVAVVTGGGRGIGAAVARRLAALGASTVICGRTLSPLAQTAEGIVQSGGQCEAVECDVSALPAVEALAQRIQQTFGRIDILVNNAGIGGFGGPLHELPPEQWDAVLNTNLRGVYYCIRAFAPMMIQARTGHIVNISSLAGKNALPGGAAYAASKWGLNGLTYSVAEELRKHNIRVAVVCPGSVDRAQPAHRQGPRQDAPARGRSSRGRHAGDPGAAVVRQRGPAAPHPEAMKRGRAHPFD